VLPLLPAGIGFGRVLWTKASLPYFADAWKVFSETLGTTLVYGSGAGLIAVALALPVAWVAGQSIRRLRGVMMAALLMTAISPSLHALGMVSLRSHAPTALGDVMATDAWVGITLGLRWVPLSALLLGLAWRELPRSMMDAVSVHGVSMLNFALRVAAPLIGNFVIATFSLAALLALADVSSTILLQPPGASSFGTRLFGVLDNAPDKRVATLSVTYALLPLLVALACASLSAVALRIRTPKHA
jgi:iron(III) transport system permease protein